MRRRNHLQVNTFPFLAVLLCAMGSLILILLVMDRRARRVAVARGRDIAGRTMRERDEAIAARERENSHKRGEVKTAYDRKKSELKARLDTEQRSLDGEMRQAQTRLARLSMTSRMRMSDPIAHSRTARKGNVLTWRWLRRLMPPSPG